MNYLIDNLSEILGYTKTHVTLALTPLLIGLVIAVPAGALIRRAPLLRKITTAVSSLAYTIPSLALFVIIPPLVGISTIDPLNVVIALAIYSTALLLIAVPAALDSVPADVVDAADAVGFSPLRRTLTVDMPLAVPVFLSSLRVIAVTNIAMVSVGALIGSGGLGVLFTQGYQRNYPDEIIAGIIVTLALALVVDRALFALGRWGTPWTRTAARPRAWRRTAKGARA
ncbi:ABC transporter permease [Nocardia sp. NPDC048505]|uniref:ABC transporter permease n=1 Tax=unclassified Nocardia TaxID=2637762 RepID=UPI0033EED539